MGLVMSLKHDGTAEVKPNVWKSRRGAPKAGVQKRYPATSSEANPCFFETASTGNTGNTRSIAF